MNLELTRTEAVILRHLLNLAHEMCSDGEDVFERLDLNTEDKKSLKDKVTSVLNLKEEDGLEAGAQDIFLYLYFAQKVEKLLSHDHSGARHEVSVDRSHDQTE